MYEITYSGTFEEPIILNAVKYSHNLAGRNARSEKRVKKKYGKGRTD